MIIFQLVRISINQKDKHCRRMFIACICSCILSFFMWFCNKVFVFVLFFSMRIPTDLPMILLISNCCKPTSYKEPFSLFLITNWCWWWECLYCRWPWNCTKSAKHGHHLYNLTTLSKQGSYIEQITLLFNIIVGVNLEPEIAKDDWTSGSVV